MVIKTTPNNHEIARKTRNKERRKEREKITRELLTRYEAVVNNGKVWKARAINARKLREND